MNIVERFLKYVSFDTQSDENSGVTPSTPKQMVFAQYLKGELEALGLEDIELDDNGYLYATLPANTDKDVPTIGFIAHMDTVADFVEDEVECTTEHSLNLQNLVTTGNQVVDSVDDRQSGTHIGFEEILHTTGTCGLFQERVVLVF